MSFITAIGIANPPNRFSQTEIANFMVKAMQLNQNESRLLQTIFKASGIDYRHSVLEDYGKDKDFKFYSNAADFEPFPTTEMRLSVFRKHVVDLSAHAIDNMLQSVPSFNVQQVTHLIVVCCTGMYAPGLDIDLVKRYNLAPSVHRTGINFMGCYAAFNAIKVADAFCHQDEHAKVLIVCTELCSLHFQKKPTEDNLLANALFADGSAAILIESRTQQAVRLKPESFHSSLMASSEQDMAWTIGDLGFEMKLSTYVPSIIKNGIAELTDTLLTKISKKISDIQYFAIHPGGKRILENIEVALGIAPEKNLPAYCVLRNYGNMSSPTILFVLHTIWKQIQEKDQNQHILSFAFGPGLTLESMVLKIEMN
ncbi:type III polyketide synthase [Chryseolinea sp. H1M3-3]|uniref:type III polyketide synthase n=1 Tax=Chryseolinea sp. H1M3-3 TaxID=3034144 RepID=UPI0023EC6EE4|nr:type III polyketide synthase [Chryseolinea sp. H1M3-3]